MKKSTPKTNKKRKLAQQILSLELQEAIAHFFTCSPPKQFSRGLRNMVIEFLSRQQGSQAPYMDELLLNLEMFFNILDRAEDEQRHG